jgi:exopolyphosphatase/pppGpp-phosphohydrolase
VHEESRQTRLGKGFYETRRLQPEAIARTAEAVWEFAKTAREKIAAPSASSPPAPRATR